ncbi:nuclear transport factor 2 family protein [Nocardia rosealba]|uniref:nuclear transport factor 2 family protein n=1 Tax=Nocardia rosealba TaxID=2878563 RepID=UPI001CD9C7CA|nr:nuclear transport factor 2 family protein [Nocardia rosealba]MCA2208479.1 ester cyclase [Nocardia rosealba]
MSTAAPITADHLAARWTELWNSDPTLAGQLLTEDFELRFASPTRELTDGLRGPADISGFVAGFRRQRPQVRFVVDSGAAGQLDADGSGTFAVRWHSEASGRPEHGGIDMFEAVGGKLRRIWSVGGSAPFTQD